MLQLLRLVAIAMSLLIAHSSWGCLARGTPPQDGDYRAIVLAEVVGVHLTDYARARLEQMHEGRTRVWQGDIRPGYKVDLIVFEVFKGSVAKTVYLDVPATCGLQTPELNQFGIFYVYDRTKAGVVLQDDPEYRDRLQGFGSRYAGTCDTTLERFGEPHPCWKPPRAGVECLSMIENMSSYLRTSCPAGVQDVYEEVARQTVAQYGWKPPLRPRPQPQK